MKVKELKEWLQDVPDDAEVVAVSPDFDSSEITYAIDLVYRAERVEIIFGV